MAGDLSDLPPEILEALQTPGPELPVDPTKPVVSAEQLAADLDYKVGERGGYDKLHVEKRQDPEEELKQPIDRYQDRVFFYPGLVHGFCNVPTSLTERFRAAMGMEVDSWLHLTKSPIVDVPSVSGFSKSRLACTLQSIDVRAAPHFFNFLEQQYMVDRNKNLVWRIKDHKVSTLDPYARDQGDEAPSLVELHVLCPGTCNGGYAPKEQSGMFVGIPVVTASRLIDPEFEKQTQEILGG